MTGYRLSPEAQSDLMDIRRSLTGQGGVMLARRVLGEIRKALRFLVETPGAGHKREDLTDEAVRFWPVFSYLIVYVSDTDPLGIARVLHGHRDLETLLKAQPPDR